MDYPEKPIPPWMEALERQFEETIKACEAIEPNAMGHTHKGHEGIWFAPCAVCAEAK